MATLTGLTKRGLRAALNPRAVATQLITLLNVTAGVAEASKVLVPDANLDLVTTGRIRSTYDAGTKNGATVTVVESGDGVVHKSVLTCAATPISVVGASGVGFGGVKIYTFPEGRILVLGVTASLEVDVLASNLEAADGGDYGIGTAIVGDADLGDATDIDLCPSTSIDPIGTAVGAALVASAHFDGTGTAKTVNLNLLIDDGDIGGTEAVGMTGTVTLSWVNLGDY